MAGDTSASLDKGYAAILAGCVTAPFRGEIWENCRNAPLGKGHNNESKPFDISTACYLRPVFQAMKEPSVRKVVIKAGVKTLKTFSVEAAVAYYIAHGMGDVAFYMADIGMAKDHAKGRLLDWWYSIASFNAMLAGITSRHDETTTELYFPNKTVRIWPANFTSTQNINLETVSISDAWCVGNTGFIEQIIQRTSQYPNTKKIFIESQGSEEGDDFDRQFEDTDMAMLNVRCPICHTAQPFLWTRTRDDHFKCVAPVEIPSLDKEAWMAEHRPKLLSRRNCGMQRGDEARVKRADGGYNETEILRGTYYECFHCGGRWEDEKKTRQWLDESSHYVTTRDYAVFSHKGFQWPKWINRRIPWGERMLDYLKAKSHEREYGDKELIKQWVQKDEAQTWSDRLLQQSASVIVYSESSPENMPGERWRYMAVDCQQDPDTKSVGHFWYVARAVDDRGNSVQLARGYATSWQQWIDIQKKLKIPNRNVAIDGRYWLPIIRAKAAEHRELGDNLLKTGKVWTTWKIMIGDAGRSWRHEDGTYKPYRQAQVHIESVIDEQGRKLGIKLNEFLWSNLMVGIQLEHLRRGGVGVPKFETLKREFLDDLTRRKEVGDLEYERQLNAEYLGKDKAGKAKFIEVKENMNHYLDAERMGLVLRNLNGFVVHVSAPDEANV